MELKSIIKKHENCIIAVGFLAILLFFTAFRYDFTYDLNDDVLMKDILSGVYTGVPESRNIQMLYPLSLLISAIYRLFPTAPVYGVFLCVCQFGCFYLIVKRSLYFRKSIGSKLFLALCELIIVTGLFLYHLIFIQYTVTSALLASTAAFLFLTTDKTLPAGVFIRKNTGNILLAVTAFLMRTEMLLLLLPLICVAGVIKWSEERPVLTGKNAVKYLTVFGGICAGLLLGIAINAAAYGGKDWKSFCRFFDSRTQLYDYQGIPPFEGNEALYEEIGLGKSEQVMLLERYNFGMDDRVDSEMIDTLSAYQAQKNEELRPFFVRLRDSIANYFYRTLHREPPAGSQDTDYPWNLMVILGYIVVFLAGIWNAVGNGRKAASGVLETGWKLVLLGSVRSLLWLYILIGNRYPQRITHPLYLMEACILFGLLLKEYAEIEEKLSGKIKAAVIFPAVLCFTAFVTVPGSVVQTDREYERRELVNGTDIAMKEYCRQHSENFYFLDVYATVSWSEKLFANGDNSLSNYDLMGGWAVKSPLQRKKLEQFSLASMKEALLLDDRVYLIALLSDGTEWLSAYYKDQKIAAEVIKTDEINGTAGVYRLSVLEQDMP